MVEQINKNNDIIILPSGQEERQKFIDAVNSVLELKEIIASSTESIKSVIENAYDNYVSNTPDPLKKGKFTKQFKLVVAEALSAKATEVNNESQGAIEVFELIKNKLI